MSIKEIRGGMKNHDKDWFILGDKAVLKSAILSVSVNDGKSLTDKSINLKLELRGGHHLNWPFKSVAQINKVLSELDLEYAPTTETVVS